MKYIIYSNNNIVIYYAIILLIYLLKCHNTKVANMRPIGIEPILEV